MTSSQHPEGHPDDGPHSQEIRHSQIGALVPAHVARGTFSTGAVVLQGQYEFIVDFLLRMQQPQQVAARVILPPGVVAQFINALQDNLRKYERRFGPIHQPAIPPQEKPQDGQRQSAQDLYDQLKLPEDVMSGNYANAVMIGHTTTEFSFDFITTFFPRSAVAQRVFLAAPNARRLLESLTHSYQQFQDRIRQQNSSTPPVPPPSPNSGPVVPGTYDSGPQLPGTMPPGALPDEEPDESAG
ncbi:MAG: DUF3467 domain-containing protein [Planctomycetaceae bacterium]|nr:DUF3467 domain-containing protein [Planctomycetaceae bacterium]